MTYRPWINRRFGVEMEMRGVTTTHEVLGEREIRAAVIQGVRAAGQPVSRVRRDAAGYFHSDGETWDVKTDATCGWEVASPALVLNEQADCDELRHVADALAAARPSIDRTCGLHVHAEVQDFGWRELRALIILWCRYEPFWFSLCPPSRRQNQYCPPFRKTVWTNDDGSYWTRINEALSSTDERGFRNILSTGSPRGSLNLAHFWRSKRVEFRLAAGTVQYEKIVRWVQMLLTLVERARRDESLTTDTIRFPRVMTGGYSNTPWENGGVQYVAKVLGLVPSKHVPAEHVPAESARLVAWMQRRYEQFNGVRRVADTEGEAPPAPDTPLTPAEIRRREREGLPAVPPISFAATQTPLRPRR